MMGFDARAARAAWSVIAVVLVLAVLFRIRNVLLVFVIAVLFAYMLAPVVNFFGRVLPRFITGRRSRGYSLALVYALLVAILIASGFLIGQKVTMEAQTLAESYPKIVAGLKDRLASPDPAWLRPLKQYILNQINERGLTVGASILPTNLTERIVTLLSSAFYVVLIPILSFFLLKDGLQLREHVLSYAGARRPMWEGIFTDLHVLLGQFIRALVILSAATFFVYTTFFTIIGVPYGALLAFWSALLEFIPVVGPLAAAVTIVAVAAVSGAGHILVIIVFLAVYRIFQDYVLNPKLMGAGIEMHPLLIILGALAGEELAGIPGIFLSVPVLATLRVFYIRIRKALAASGNRTFP